MEINLGMKFIISAQSVSFIYRLFVSQTLSCDKDMYLVPKQIFLQLAQLHSAKHRELVIEDWVAVIGCREAGLPKLNQWSFTNPIVAPLPGRPKQWNKLLLD